MKINYENERVKVDVPRQENNLSEIFADLKQKYDNVFIYQIEEQLFMFKALGRAEFKRLTSEIDNVLEQEDIICQTCILWPEDFDFDSCEAGLPSALAKAVLKASYLDSREAQLAAVHYYRQEMFALDNQITCMINEAFPQFDIEEIEQWDIAKTAKYLSRAEWKFANLRGMPLMDDPFAYDPQEEQQEESQTEEVTSAQQVNAKGGNKEKLSPEKLAELQRRFPEINWADDSAAKGGVDALQSNIDTLAPALRTGY